MNRYFSKEDMQMASRCMKKWSMSLTSGKCESKSLWDISYPLSWKKTKDNKCWWKLVGKTWTLAHFIKRYYLFIWLHQVLVEACRIFRLPCDMWIFSCGTGALHHVGSSSLTRDSNLGPLHWEFQPLGHKGSPLNPCTLAGRNAKWGSCPAKQHGDSSKM